MKQLFQKPKEFLTYGFPLELLAYGEENIRVVWCTKNYNVSKLNINDIEL
jgi:hypothetical protein